ncbi:hypothetical protein BDR05DRAFT_964581, partial [Suillus weaverae]
MHFMLFMRARSSSGKSLLPSEGSSAICRFRGSREITLEPSQVSSLSTDNLSVPCRLL